ncbi:MAG: O-methyltransferase [Oscillospiraceae bacterium]|nr:O-methyltransferase [Oscillospiraceae bacterium]
MDVWVSNDSFISEFLVEEDVALKQAFERSRELNLPDMEISPAQGKFLYLLARIKNAKRILEIGTFCGYSTIWLAKAVADGGIVISLECDESYANIAKKNIDSAGLSNQATVLTGDAINLLNQMIAAKEEYFDMIFIDADKPNYPQYLELSLQLAKNGTIICGDNVIRNGELVNTDNFDPKVQGVRRFVEMLGHMKALESTALQTVGVKGYDGFTVSIVK